MEFITDPIHALVAHVEARGVTRLGRRTVAGWHSSDSSLSGWTTAGEIADACRSATGPEQDRLIGALLAAGDGDELAVLTVVAGLAGRLQSVLRGWERAGAAAWELPGLAADLVTQCWAATAELAARVVAGRPAPTRVAWHLVDEAREAVRVPRRRERRRAVRQLSWEEQPALSGPQARTVEEALAGEIADAVRAGRISRAAAAPVFLTRVAGFGVGETADRLGCSPALVRAVRSRAERRLIAAAA